LSNFFLSFYKLSSALVGILILFFLILTVAGLLGVTAVKLVLPMCLAFVEVLLFMWIDEIVWLTCWAPCSNEVWVVGCSLLILTG